ERHVRRLGDVVEVRPWRVLALIVGRRAAGVAGAGQVLRVRPVAQARRAELLEQISLAPERVRARVAGDALRTAGKQCDVVRLAGMGDAERLAEQRALAGQVL